MSSFPPYQFPEVKTPLETQNEITNAAALREQGVYYKDRNNRARMEREQEEKRLATQKLVQEIYARNWKKDSKGVAYYDHEKIQSELVAIGLFEEAARHQKDQVQLKKERMEATEKQRKMAEEAAKAMLPYLKTYANAENRLAVYNAVIVPAAKEKGIEWIPDEWNGQIDDRLVSLYHHAQDEKSRLLTPEEEEQYRRMHPASSGRGSDDRKTTQDILQEDGKVHVMGYNPDTGKYDIDMGEKGSITGDKARAQEEMAAPIAAGIVAGTQTPVLPRGTLGFAVKKILAEKYPEYDHAAALLDYKATETFVRGQNSPTPVALLRAIETYRNTLNQLDDLYKDFKRKASGTRFARINKAQIQLAAEAGGELGAVATTLISGVKDSHAELATIYKGGSSPTDAFLEQASTSLKYEWDPESWARNTQMIRENLDFKERTLKLLQPMGRSSDVYSRGRPGAAEVRPVPPPPAPRGSPGTTPGGIELERDPATGKLKRKAR